jgi:hypothetical protein
VLVSRARARRAASAAPPNRAVSTAFSVFSSFKYSIRAAARMWAIVTELRSAAARKAAFIAMLPMFPPRC